METEKIMNTLSPLDKSLDEMRLPKISGGPEIINDVIRDICELPDRTSPEDCPDTLIVTVDELRIILERYLL